MTTLKAGGELLPRLLHSKKRNARRAHPHTQYPVVRDIRLTQHSIPRDAEAEAGLSYGFPLPSVKWRDEDKVYMKPEHDEDASSSEGGDARKSNLILNTYVVIPGR